MPTQTWAHIEADVDFENHGATAELYIKNLSCTQERKDI